MFGPSRLRPNLDEASGPLRVVVGSGGKHCAAESFRDTRSTEGGTGRMSRSVGPRPRDNDAPEKAIFKSLNGSTLTMFHWSFRFPEGAPVVFHGYATSSPPVQQGDVVFVHRLGEFEIQLYKGAPKARGGQLVVFPNESAIVQGAHLVLPRTYKVDCWQPNTKGLRASASDDRITLFAGSGPLRSSSSGVLRGEGSPVWRQSRMHPAAGFYGPVELSCPDVRKLERPGRDHVSTSGKSHPNMDCLPLGNSTAMHTLAPLFRERDRTSLLHAL
mmetsp:Transcript_28449/g.64548  ORF Transcript_28449/g.64548 Transcript_28449/m.64548 type:complete len:272 (+) Transcript_28449:22-837(+)